MSKSISYLICGCFLLISFGLNPSVMAEPTRLIVRAQAMDAKFIGTSVGGALIIVRNADTGTILAKGLTEGSTGDTNLIMNEPKYRDDSITKGAAKFEAVINIEEPTYVTIEVHSPYIKKQSRVFAQTQLWLIPGKHIDGDGIIIQVPGFIVDALSPQTHRYLNEDKLPIKIKANVVMMCGCTIQQGGLWDSDNYEIKALIKQEGKIIDEIPLEFVSTNTFEVFYRPDKNGPYEVIIYAYDPQTGNTGVDKTSFILN